MSEDLKDPPGVYFRYDDDADSGAGGWLTSEDSLVAATGSGARR